MLSWEEDVEAHSLRKRGWTISAIARHLGRDRKTIAAYLNGGRQPGRRAAAGPDAFGSFEEYCRIRLTQDPHLWATTLFEEVAGLGYGGGYSSFTRALRDRGLRPHCEPCHQAKGRDVGIIAHGPGEETYAESRIGFLMRARAIMRRCLPVTGRRDGRGIDAVAMQVHGAGVAKRVRSDVFGGQ
jgi:hypothetical protein